jgi:hypothetical protein
MESERTAIGFDSRKNFQSKVKIALVNQKLKLVPNGKLLADAYLSPTAC